MQNFSRVIQLNYYNYVDTKLPNTIKRMAQKISQRRRTFSPLSPEWHGLWVSPASAPSSSPEPSRCWPHDPGGPGKPLGPCGPSVPLSPVGPTTPGQPCSPCSIQPWTAKSSIADRADWLIDWVRLKSHQTHYRSYQERVFTGQMTQPTVSKHWRKIGPKDQASIPSGPPHRARNNTTAMQYETKKHKYT